MILPHKVLSCAMLEWTEQWFVYYAVLHSHCFINTIATSASLVLGAWCLVVCIIRLGHVEFMGDLMLNKPLQTWFKMAVIPLVHHSGPWQLGLAPAGWFLVPSGSHLQHPSAGSWGSCPNMMGGDCWSAVTPGIPGPSESPCPVEQPSLFYLVDCMQHEMAVHMLVPFCIYHVWPGLWAKARCKGLGNSRVKKDSFLQGGTLYCNGMNSSREWTGPFFMKECWWAQSCTDNHSFCEFMSSTAILYPEDSVKQYFNLMTFLGKYLSS